jgi:hypothetical protein
MACLGLMMSAHDTTDILQSKTFAEAVVRINKRAERQLDPAKLVEIFVETDLPLRCESTDHQLVLGRRGTGKTHLLKYFQVKHQELGDVVHYSDCTVLGSGLPSISTNPLTTACKYFAALLNDLGTMLLDQAVRLENPAPGVEDRVFQSLTDGLVAFMTPAEAETLSVFNYRQIAETLKQVLKDLGITRLFILLDEWAQIPLAAQPYVAEFIKRAILPIQAISVKLLAVNYQCKFSDHIDGNLIGMQRGADFTDVIDIDKYLIFDEKTAFVSEFFGQLLYNHLGVELGWDLSLTPQKKISLVKLFFTQEAAFTELVRAAEGNCRDFICIFSKAYLEGYRQSMASKSISIPQVCNASSSWYTNEKESNIKTELKAQRTLTVLLDRVLKGYKSRTFLVEMGNEEHPNLIRLLNERILHRLNEVYSHPDRPGLRYELFTLDHGAYIKFRGTVNEARQEVFFYSTEVATLEDEERKSVVPFDDRRSIRRIVFDPGSSQVETD